MSIILSIASKEFRSSFVTPLAYVILAGFICMSGFFFFSLLQQYNGVVVQAMLMPDLNLNLNEWVITPYFQTLEIILLFLIPILTMRSIAEEKRNGTFELLITSPITVSEIVLGKFLGISFVVGIMLLLSFSFPLTLLFFANPELAPMLGGFLGVFLFALMFTAIGIAISASTKSQTIAGVVGLVIMLLFYVIHAPAEYFGGWAGSTLQYISPSNRLSLISKGVFDLSDFIYFCSVILVGLFFANRILDAERWR